MPKKNTIAQEKYDRSHCIRISIKLNTKTDAPILALLEKTPSMSGLIRRLLTEYISTEYPELLDVQIYNKSDNSMFIGKELPSAKENTQPE